MSTVKANNVQVGQSGTATNNFTLYQPSSPDGTVRLAVGNSGATSADVLTANSSGNVGIGTSSPSQKLEVSAAGAAAIRVSSSDGTSAALELVRVGAGGDYRFRNAGGVLFLDYGTDDSSFATLAAQFSSGGAIGVGTNAASSGSGITFPATQSASSDANTLDDYEEGTFTPTTSNISFASATGTYTKIGRVVQIGIALTWPTTSDANQVVISGLPFTCANNDPSRCGVSVAYSEYTTVVTTMVNKNSTNLYLYKWSGNQPTNAELSAKTLFLGGTYLV